MTYRYVTVGARTKAIGLEKREGREWELVRVIIEGPMDASGARVITSALNDAYRLGQATARTEYDRGIDQLIEELRRI